MTLKRLLSLIFTFKSKLFFSKNPAVIFLLLVSHYSLSQAQNSQPTALLLKKMSMEELMNIEVTSVSKQPEKLKDVSSAIQVITQEDIRRSGASSLPEALRLASNLQVAQVNSSQWAISARGFTNVLSNKLLVLVDGRVIYTPMYAGVFWDIQNLLMEDIDHIEVISGPGGTLWGANAVNGVINIITKSSKDTKGFFAEVAAGSELRSLASLRYGGKIKEKITYRAYATAAKRGNTLLRNGKEAYDNWTMGKGGFRFDWDATQKDLVTLQSDLYDARPQPDGGEASVAQGGNVIARWNHNTSEHTNFQLQGYYNQTWRKFPNKLSEYLRTYDLDFQHHFRIAQRNELIWGAGLRFMNHEVKNIPSLGFLPEHKNLHVFNVFVQDKIRLVKERLILTLGSKLEHNNYTGFQIQPNARLSWTPTRYQTIWGAISRAVRNPARTDREIYANLAPGVTYIQGNSNFVSETLMAYELGWRVQPYEKLSVSLATFYNFYDNIRSAEPVSSAQAFPITLGNGVRGETYGVELSATYQVIDWWRLRGGYTALGKELSIKPNRLDLNNATAESNDPKHLFLVQSSMDLPGNLEFSTVIRYVDKLPKPHVRGYVGLDARLGWKLNKVLELDIVGQNLIDERHIEFIPSSPSPRKIQRSVYGKIVCRF